jgi:hypothetical protein
MTYIVVNKSPHHGKPVEICFLQQQQLKIVDRKGQKDSRAGRAITQCRGVDSYLPRVTNQSESEILNSRGKNAILSRHKFRSDSVHFM